MGQGSLSPWDENPTANPQPPVAGSLLLFFLCNCHPELLISAARLLQDYDHLLVRLSISCLLLAL